MALSALKRLRQIYPHIRQTVIPLRQPTRFHQNSTETNANDQGPVTQSIEDFLDVKISTQDDTTFIEGVLKPTGREGKVVKSSNSNACALCRLNLKNLDYTDVKILSQWIKSNGMIATYEESKLCSKQYNKILNLIKKAQRCNLIERPANYFVPGPWHDMNTYLETDRRRDQPIKVIKKQYWRM